MCACLRVYLAWVKNDGGRKCFFPFSLATHSCQGIKPVSPIRNHLEALRSKIVNLSIRYFCPVEIFWEFYVALLSAIDLQIAKSIFMTRKEERAEMVSIYDKTGINSARTRCYNGRKQRGIRRTLSFHSWLINWTIHLIKRYGVKLF